MPTRTVVTVGNFDGVHAGHAALAHRARHLADANSARVLALVFDPHPISVLAPARTPSRLSTFERRAELLRSEGVDEVERLEPTPELLDMSPDEFIAWVVERHHPIAFVEGDDFRFGNKRAGDIETLRAIGGHRGFDVELVNEIDIELLDQQVVRASSSVVRWLIAEGRLRDAARVLGRPYEVTGTVRRGDQRGRTIGIPTANIHTPCLHPRDGIYAGLAHLPRGTVRPAAVHVGERPTFDGATPSLEAHVLDWSGHPDNIEYDWHIRLELHAFLRDQSAFEGVESLVEQINRDIARTREAIAPALTGAAT
ncbi:MAG: riboflavin biosynthesis protein RibF [Planctomycetota bacterium]